MPDLSIAIVTFNNEIAIKKSVKSLITYLGDRFSHQIYVIVNYSQNKTVDIVKSISNKIIIIQNDKNVGFGTAHNQLINLLDSRYHLVVNPDIAIVNNCIAEMAKRNPTFVDLFIRLAFPHSFDKRQNYFEMRDTGYDKEFEIEYATGCFLFFRTDIFKKLPCTT